MGGPRALAELGVRPSVYHLNEGHSAFLVLERAGELVEADGLGFDEALARVRASTVFTTHTPVPAGNEVFDHELVRGYLEPLAERCGVDVERLLALGVAPGEERLFGLTPLALRTSSRANAVSALHGEVARRMWAGLNGTPEPAAIGHVTNGVHPGTWLSPGLAGVLRGLGVRPEDATDENAWERVRGLDAATLWRVHSESRRTLLDAVELRGGGRLDPDAITIGFARRFATYKRADLLLSDRERLLRLLGDPDRPVQVVVAGKAHPADQGGKDLLAEIVRFARDERDGGGRLVFLEDYEMALAALLVQGADVWLNTPRRPLEASGTSGMKAALNGVLNVSILDGWWAEGYEPGLGWAIGGREVPATTDEQDTADAAALYRVLEDEVVPTFYDRNEDGVPERWAAMMTASIAALAPRFSSHRMVQEYVEQLYLPAHRGAAGYAFSSR